MAWTGVCLLVIVAPFEALQPIVRFPGQSFSSVEVILFAVLASWLAAVAIRGERPRLQTSLTWPWLAVVLTGLVAASVAPADRANALHMVGRSSLAFSVFLMTVSGVGTPARLRAVLIAAAGAGVVISVLVGLEFLGNGVVLRVLQTFRPGVAVVGAQVRAAGPFQYPTIASMYLEIVFAFTLGLLLAAVDAKRMWAVVAVIGTLALIAEAVVLTFTRAGLLTMAASLLVVGGLRYRQAGLDRGAIGIALVAAIVSIEIFSSRSADVLRLRMTTEGQNEWYHATIEAPLDVALQTGGITTVPISVTNSGRMTWDPAADHPFRLSYHWLKDDGDGVAEWEGMRTLFAAPVPSGVTVDVPARVRAPGQPGRFRLLWDIEQEDQLWFSSEPEAVLVETRATVSGPTVAALKPSHVRFFPKARARPGRMVLWRAAGRMITAHPLVGVGPDNFRLSYGGYAGIANADPRVHSNNMYLEVLAGTGIFGGLAFLWLGYRVIGRVVAIALQSTSTSAAGIVAASVAIAAHGTVDAFLSFTATYILIAVTLGLTVAPGAIAGPHAHCV